MRDLQVGDLVRYVGHNDFNPWTLLRGPGAVGEIIHKYSDVAKVRYPDRYQLYAAVPGEPMSARTSDTFTIQLDSLEYFDTSRYLPGDRVRYTGKHYSVRRQEKVGKLGTVVSDTVLEVRVRWDDLSLGEETGVLPENLEKVLSDPINHPTHYTSHPSGVECITITEHMSFTLGNAVKYIWRADLKADALEDLKKARFYIDREIARREKA